MNYVKPPTAPSCWSTKYQDGDPECFQCLHKDSCRSALLDRVASQPVKPPTPSIITIPPRPFLPIQPPQTTAPTVFRPPTTSITQPPPIVQYQPPLQQQYQPYQQHQPYLPDPSNPNPMAPMFRPGAQGPAYYFAQYPGESTTTRLGKNMALRAGEAVFGELMFFFRHWTWPPRA